MGLNPKLQKSYPFWPLIYNKPSGFQMPATASKKVTAIIDQFEFYEAIKLLDFFEFVKHSTIIQNSTTTFQVLI